MYPTTKHAFAGDVAIAYKVHGALEADAVPLVVLLPQSNRTEIYCVYEPDPVVQLGHQALTAMTSRR